MRRLLSRIRKFFTTRTIIVPAYHALYHRVARRLGIARAEVRFLRGELEGLYDRIDGQTHRILEYRKENRALRAQLEALTKVDASEEVTKPGLVAVRENLAQ